MLEHKTFRLDIKTVDENGEGTFSGIASVYDVKDAHDEVADQGAAKRSLDHKGGKVFLLHSHDPSQRLGLANLAEAGNKITLDGVLNMGKQLAKDVYSDLRFYAAHNLPLGLSIGFKTIRDSWRDNIRHLEEIAIWETSIVTFGANPGALVGEVKGALAHTLLPLANEATAWSAAKAKTRIKEWAADADGDLDPAKLAKVFLYRDSEMDAATLAAHKLPVADIIDGSPKAVPRAVFAIAAALQGGRGGIDIPEADATRIKAVISRYYKKLDREPPWTPRKSRHDLAVSLLGLLQWWQDQGVSLEGATVTETALMLQTLAAEPLDLKALYQGDGSAPSHPDPGGLAGSSSASEVRPEVVHALRAKLRSMMEH